MLTKGRQDGDRVAVNGRLELTRRRGREAGQEITRRTNCDVEVEEKKR